MKGVFGQINKNLNKKGSLKKHVANENKGSEIILVNFHMKKSFSANLKKSWFIEGVVLIFDQTP